MKWTLGGILLLVVASSSANAALLSRLSGQAYYDDVLNITWLADANYADTSGYVAGGQMDWPTAQAFIASLNTANHLGVSDWRLPTVTDTGPSGCNFAYTGTDCGYNVDLTTGEMAHMYYSTLGNTGYYDTSGSPTGCSGSSPFCLTNVGPFSNLQPSYYWSGTEYALDTCCAWNFDFSAGGQVDSVKTTGTYAWAVRPGDISAVPVPAAAWLLGSALSFLGWVRRSAGEQS